MITMYTYRSFPVSRARPIVIPACSPRFSCPFPSCLPVTASETP